jgi:hypothetical protein
MSLPEPVRDRRFGRRAWLLGAISVGELLLLLGALVPLMGAATALDQGKPASISYLGWTGTASKPMVFVIVSLAGGALGGTLHAIASLTAHVAKGDFDQRWTLWYLTNPVVGASLAVAFLFVLQAGLGGQAAPTAGGLYGIAAVATLVGLFSRHALDKLNEIFDVVFARKPAAGPGAVTARAADDGSAPAGAGPAGITPDRPGTSPASTPAGTP